MHFGNGIKSVPVVQGECDGVRDVGASIFHHKIGEHKTADIPYAPCTWAIGVGHTTLIEINRKMQPPTETQTVCVNRSLFNWTSETKYPFLFLFRRYKLLPNTKTVTSSWRNTEQEGKRGIIITRLFNTTIHLSYIHCFKYHMSDD